jgi:hypothetical protein
MSPWNDERRWGSEHAELLRRGDPAAGPADPPRRAALRARVLAAADPRPAGIRRFGWLPLVGLAAAAIVAAVLLDRTPPPPAAASATDAPAADSAPQLSRQVLFATPGGTRIVWVLRDQDPF